MPVGLVAADLLAAGSGYDGEDLVVLVEHAQRTFASRAGIPEDEACGSGAMRMAAAFGRQLILHHGRGSIIYAKPGPPGYADIGGYVTEDAPRTVSLSRFQPG